MVPSKPIVMSALSGATQQLPGSQSFNWSTPLVSLPGRAGLDVNLVLQYNSRVWDLNTADNNITFNIDRDFPSYGFRLDYGYLEKDTTDGFWILTESDGSKHQLNLTTTNIWDSNDSTYIELNSGPTNVVVSYANGTQVTYQLFPNLPSGSDPLYRPIQITDTNGNYISISYVTSSDVVANQRISTIVDTLGRTITFNYNGSGQLTSITQGSFTYASFQWSTVSLNYNFSGLTVADTPASGTAINVLTRCTLPNGTYYTFSYGDWGIVNRVDNFSSNGTRRSYQSYNYPTASTALSDVPTYTQQAVSPDGTTQYAWSYSTTKSGDIVSAQSITDPSNTVTTINLNTSDPCSGTAASVVVSSGSTTLRTITNTWTADSNGNNCQLTKAVTTFNDSSQSAETDYQYDSNGNLTDQKDYGFDGSLLRESVATFNAPTNNHILNEVNSVVVKDAGGTKRSRTDFAYDGSSLLTQSGASHSSDVSGSRGNLTSVTRYINANAGTGTITRNFSYDNLGNMITAQLDCCNQKTWTYSSATQFGYPDSVTRGSGAITLTTSATYDFASGLILTNTDENNQVTQFTYDSARRPSTVTLPNSAVFTTVYDDASAQAAVTASNNINSLVQVTTVDGLGRSIKRQTKNGQSTVVSTIDTAYDGMSRVTSASNPYAPGDTEIYTNTTYDALGRVTQISPGATSPTGGASAGSYQTSYSGNAVTSTDPTGKQVRRISDALGRLIEVDEPTLSSTLTISGNEQFVAGSNPTAGSGTVTIGGAEQSIWFPPQTYCAWYTENGGCADWETDPGYWIYDAGTITVTVNGFSKSVNYGQGDTATSIASNLASAFNGDASSPVSASSSSGVVTLTAKTTGSATNYSLSTAVTYDSGDFSSASFSATRSGANLTGGSNGQNTIYDAGTVSATVNGFTKSVSYGQGSTSSTIASALVSAFNNDSNSPVVATVPNGGNVITFDAITFSGNSESLTASSTYDTTHFSSASFTTTAGGSLTGNLNVPAVTTYTYRPTGELTGVTSGAQTRTYAYDDLGRLTSNTLPESGQTQFTYTDFGTVQSRTDARGVITNYSYDGLNRPTQISYNVGTTGVPAAATVGFTYGTSAASFNNGRLYQMTDGAGSETYTYNNMGWTTNIAKLINSTAYNIGYAYDALGNPTQITYPSNRVVGQTYDAIGRRQTVTNAGGTALSINSYNAAGQVLGLTYGNSVGGSFTYNDHLQLSSLTYTSGANTLLSMTYNYGSQNNGQIQGITDSRGAAYSTTYTYDPLRRLALAQTNDLTAANTWKLAWQYDRYGNRLSQTLTGGTMSISQPQLSINAATNRATNTGFAYDANGNMTNDGLHQYAFDADNRMVSVDSGATASYSYDGNGLRVVKGSTVYVFNGAKVIAEYSGGTLQKEYIYAGGSLLATVTASAVTYHHPDHLSNRVETDAGGNVVRTFGSLPFGDSWYETGTADKWKFTTYERDSETGLDYALMRFSSSGRLGRFMSPDPMGGNIFDPQSLNRYLYVRNDPMNLVDPFGLDACPPGSAAEACFSSTGHGSYPDKGADGKGGGGVAGGGGGGGGGVAQVPSQCGDPSFSNCNGHIAPLQDGGPGGGQVGASGKEDGLNPLRNAAKKLKNMKLDKKECQDDLKALGITADQVRQAAGQTDFINGVGSTVLLSSLYPPNLAKFVTGTVGSDLAQPGHVAVASLVSNVIYANPANIPTDFNHNMGIDFHEIVHNITGFTDPDIQRALGLKEGGPSDNISQKLMKDCF